MFEQKLKGRTIALIGGAGFIGHNLALELKKHGADPHVIDGLQVNNLVRSQIQAMTRTRASMLVSFSSGCGCCAKPIFRFMCLMRATITR